MPQPNADLLKAAKSLAGHFKKMAGFEKTKAEYHEKCMTAHKAHAEHFEEAMGKAADPDKEGIKKTVAFHKSMSNNHEKIYKAHTASAEHLGKMQEAHASGDYGKVFEALGEEMPVDPVVTAPPAAAAAVVTDPVVDPAKKAVVADPAPTTDSINDTIQKALDTKLTEAVTGAFERVLNSEDFNKQVDNAISKKLLEKLGTSTVPTDIKTFPVARATGTNGGGNGTAHTIPDLKGVDPELADMVKFE